MKNVSLKQLLVGLAMLATAGLALAITPTRKIADDSPQVNLETLIPDQFGEWKQDGAIVPLLPDPAQTALLNKIYNQILSRTYINSHGDRIMLSIVYGGDQSDGMAVHKPEVCYPAQGFKILNNSTDALSTRSGPIPVKRLVATQGQRIEPITYWTTIGDNVAVDGLKWKLYQLKYGLTGKIPDGLLVRISSIQPDTIRAFEMQDDFARTLLAALTPTERKRLAGQQIPSS